GCTRIPTLYKKNNDGVTTSVFRTNAEKAALFAEAFFPPKPTTLPPMEDDEKPHLLYNSPPLHHIKSSAASTNLAPTKPLVVMAYPT
ncbi:hypothetical protein K439DRAFT_1551860, partial [Ramaria rubella]